MDCMLVFRRFCGVFLGEDLGGVALTGAAVLSKAGKEDMESSFSGF